jgi:hypothetical protein
MVAAPLPQHGGAGPPSLKSLSPPPAGAPARLSCYPSDYDIEIIREVILIAEERVRRECARGSGARELTLLKLLDAYDMVGGRRRAGGH